MNTIEVILAIIAFVNIISVVVYLHKFGWKNNLEDICMYLIFGSLYFFTGLYKDIKFNIERFNK